MLRKLAKVANRLDSLGLTKEADIVDAEIGKIIRLAAFESDIGGGSGIADDFEDVDPDTISVEEVWDASETTQPQHTNSPEQKLISMLFGRETLMKDSRFVDQITGEPKPVEEIAAELGITDPEIVDALDSLLDSNGLYTGGIDRYTGRAN